VDFQLFSFHTMYKCNVSFWAVVVKIRIMIIMLMTLFVFVMYRTV